MFSEENKMLERWQGPPRITKLKQYKLCCPLRSVCLFTHKNKQSCLFSLIRQKKLHRAALSELLHFSFVCVVMTYKATWHFEELPNDWSQNHCFFLRIFRSTSSFLRYFQARQWHKKARFFFFFRYFNGILEFLTSWKHFQNADDTSCSQGCDSSLWHCHGCIQRCWCCEERIFSGSSSQENTWQWHE